MWFKFPKGCDAVSVERQSFRSEATDAEGRGYFRAPPHFAARILAMNLGFVADVSPPEGSPADFPKEDPLRDGAIAELTKANEALRLEIAALRSDLEAERAKSRAIATERNDFADKISKLNATIEGLQEQLEDKPAVPPAKPRIVA